MNFRISVSILSFTLLFTSCAELSGKKTVTDTEINAEAAKAYAEVKSKSKLSTNKEWTAMVQRVANRIAAASGENFQWEVILIENKEPNAWCMPGGKMAVYTGIMPILKTEGALAAVMGHEVAHATLHHGKEGYARAIQEQYWGIIAGVTAIAAGQLLCKSDTCKQGTAVAGAAVGFGLTFFNRKFSRENESEADKSGQIYMAKAGYEPAESLELWDRMAKASGGKVPPEWMSTHPSNENRQRNLGSWLPAAKQIYAQSPDHYGTGQAIR